jgi:hypothetical protein
MEATALRHITAARQGPSLADLPPEIIQRQVFLAIAIIWLIVYAA